MLLVTDLAVMDHVDGSVWLVANAINYDNTDERVEQAYEDAVARLDQMVSDLHAPATCCGGRRAPGAVAKRSRSTRVPRQGRGREGVHPGR
jgi:anthranilate synthase component 1